MKNELIVIKIGSSTLTHLSGHINIRRLEALVKVLADIKNSGKTLVIVSSGAVSVGMGKMNLKARPAETAAKQALAAIGQCELMYLYDKLFSEYNHTVAQVLLTKDVVEKEADIQNVKNTFERLLGMGVIPIVNENDTVCTSEIEFGDNDNLSAVVAGIIGADELIIVSDVDGLYTANPAKDPTAKRIETVAVIDEHIRSIAGGAGSGIGTGGMATKVAAADYAGERGIKTTILCGKDPSVLYDALEGKTVGTRFLPQKEKTHG